MCAPTRSANGAAGSRRAGLAARRPSPPTGPRLSRWRTHCAPNPGWRCRSGAARTWPANWPPAAASASTVRRWLAGDALKPWQHRSWISVRDPQFAAKAARVLDLYAGIWDGRPPGANDYVICADEKTSIQARCRCRPALAPRQGPRDARRARL
ncbi:MAG TPA: hypothetical protein VF060_09680 [Trebonia sp.]